MNLNNLLKLDVKREMERIPLCDLQTYPRSARSKIDQHIEDLFLSGKMNKQDCKDFAEGFFPQSMNAFVVDVMGLYQAKVEKKKNQIKSLDGKKHNKITTVRHMEKAIIESTDNVDEAEGLLMRLDDEGVDTRLTDDENYDAFIQNIKDNAYLR